MPMVYFTKALSTRLQSVCVQMPHLRAKKFWKLLPDLWRITFVRLVFIYQTVKWYYKGSFRMNFCYFSVTPLLERLSKSWNTTNSLLKQVRWEDTIMEKLTISKIMDWVNLGVMTWDILKCLFIYSMEAMMLWFRKRWGVVSWVFKSFVSFYSLQAVEKLLKELGSFRKRIFYVPRDNEKSPFNHLDFIMAKDVKKDLYDQIFRIMREQLSEVDIV